MPSLEDAALDYGGVDLELADVVVVHLLLFGPDMGAPSFEQARAWSDHFDYTGRANHVVLVGDERLLGGETRAMIPGLQLVDRDLTLRFDAAGRAAPHDLWSELWPALSGVLARS